MSGGVTIDQALAAFLEDQRARLAARTFGTYEDVVSLLRTYLNGYGYMALEAEDELRWREAFEAGDEEAFSRLVGAEYILGAYDDFLSYFMVAKVMAGETLLRAAGTVTKKLAVWLEEQGYADPDDIEHAKEAAADARRDLPLASRLGDILYAWTEEVHVVVGADDPYVDEYLAIERVEPGRLWFERGYGPVDVPPEATELACPGWTVNVVLTYSGKRWHLVEAGNVYP